jgi:dTDP-4-amino-4,6-dideoxygalactose transaminase
MSERVLARMDFAAIRERRAGNYRRLAGSLSPDVVQVFPTLPDGVCPLFFPIVVADKQRAADALRARGVDALEFWNESAEPGGHEMGADARFLRRHVLELPIHQDLTPRHLDHVARQVSALAPRMAA